MIISKIKRYSLFCVAFIVELWASFSFLDLYLFPLLTPALFFCELMLYLELSNIILLSVMGIGMDLLCGDPMGKYTFFMFLFSATTLFLRNKLLYVSPPFFWLSFILVYSLTLLGCASIFVLLGFALPTPYFMFRAVAVGSLLFLPVLGMYAYSFSRRLFIEGRYVKR